MAWPACRLPIPHIRFSLSQRLSRASWASVGHGQRRTLLDESSTPRLRPLDPAADDADGAKTMDDQPGLGRPAVSSATHNSLATFLQYARRTGLDPASTVFIGTHYEYMAAAALARYGFSLTRVGGKSDGGIDLAGSWTPAPSQTPIRVVVQCKAGLQAARPQHMRELEGALVGAPPGPRGSGLLGLLVSPLPASRGVRDTLARSRWPLAFVCCSSRASHRPVVSQFLWNRRAEDDGLLGYTVALRHTDRASPEQELVLLCDGAVVPFAEASNSDQGLGNDKDGDKRGRGS